MTSRIFVVFFVLLVLIGGGMYFGTRTIPAPTHTVEKVISNDHFSK